MPPLEAKGFRPRIDDAHPHGEESLARLEGDIYHDVRALRITREQAHHIAARWRDDVVKPPDGAELVAVLLDREAELQSARGQPPVRTTG